MNTKKSQGEKSWLDFLLSLMVICTSVMLKPWDFHSLQVIALHYNWIASDNNGYTMLRFDDTNPEKEGHEYIVNIEENVKWLGYTVNFF